MKITTLNTESFEIIMGVTAGYFHNNENENKEVEFRADYQKIAGEIFDECGIYVSAIITSGDVIYHQDWGCPVGGEKVFIIKGERNPLFMGDPERYRKIVEEITQRLMSKYEQTTCSLTWKEVTFSYFQSQE